MSSPGDPIDFVPAACEASAIANCLLSKQCKLGEVQTPTFARTGSFGADITSLTDIWAQVKQLDICILAAIQQAFIQAGCQLPDLPDVPDPPDLSDCLDEMDKFVENVNTELGPATGIITLTYGPDGVTPVRIQA